MILARLILAAGVMPTGTLALSDWLPVPVRAAGAAVGLGFAVAALFLPTQDNRPPVEAYVPAPLDTSILMHHAEQLCPVPAVAAAPVDDLLAAVPVLTPMFELEDGGLVPSTEVVPGDRLLAVERAVLTIAERMDDHATKSNDVLNQFAELIGGKITDIDRRLAALEQMTRHS